MPSGVDSESDSSHTTDYDSDAVTSENSSTVIIISSDSDSDTFGSSTSNESGNTRSPSFRLGSPSSLHSESTNSNNAGSPANQQDLNDHEDYHEGDHEDNHEDEHEDELEEYSIGHSSSSEDDVEEVNNSDDSDDTSLSNDGRQHPNDSVVEVPIYSSTTIASIAPAGYTLSLEPDEDAQHPYREDEPSDSGNMQRVRQEPQPSTSGTEKKDQTKRSLKRPAAVLDSESEDEDQRCPICLDAWSGTGEHRLCSLACGHLFGKSCIERWMKKGAGQGKRCPQCNKPCKKGDIRPLFATAIKVKEVSEEEKLQQQLQAALKEKKELEMKLLRTELKMAMMEKANTAPVASCSTSVTNQPASDKVIFEMIKEVPIGDKGGGRVMCFCPWATQLSVSRASKLSGFGVMQLQCERNFIYQSMESIHSKMIRDLTYFPTGSNSLLLTASLDRTAKLIDYRCNLVVQTYKSTAPLWSCCWDMTGSPTNECQMVSLGMTSGTVARYDMRKVGTEPMMTLGKREDQSPVSSLVSLYPGCCPTLPRGGLIVSQLNTCRLYVGDKDEEGTLLPFQQPFLCIRYENSSGHILVSTRAQNGRPTTHTVLHLSQEQEVEPSELFDPVLSLQGANKQTLLSRPCITSFRENDLIVAANQEESRIVPLWSVATGSRIASVPISDDVLDICSFSVNAINYFGLLMDKKIAIYRYHM